MKELLIFFAKKRFYQESKIDRKSYPIASQEIYTLIFLISKDN